MSDRAMGDVDSLAKIYEIMCEQHLTLIRKEIKHIILTIQIS